MANNNGRGCGDRLATIVSYRECRMNYARQRGHYAFDGCRQFLRAGYHISPPAAFFCATCGCYRSLYRVEEVPVQVDPAAVRVLSRMTAAAAGFPPPPLYPRAPAPATGAAEQEENLDDGEVEEEVPREPRRKKGRRARYSKAQKVAMIEYAVEELEWSLQGHDAEELRRFCSKIGIAPQVFKVWMKNNRRKYMVVEAAESSSAGGCHSF